MSAVYPGAIRSFTTKVNNIDIIDAAHPNVLQFEVVALETTLGVNPNISVNSTGSGWISTATTFANVAARLNNIEQGLSADAHSQYVRNAGGSTIQSSGSSVKGLTVKGAAGQSANLQEWQTSDGTVVAYVSPTGELVSSSGNQELENLIVNTWVFG